MKKTLRLLSIAAMLLLLAVSCKKEEEVVSPCLCFTAQERNSTVSMVGHELNLLKLETSTDGIKWEPFFPEETTITLKHKGDKVYFRGDNPDGLSNRNRRANFVMSGKIAASGNVMSLLDPTCQMTVIPSEYCFWKLFDSCISLITAPELPATTLTDNCYNKMFAYCTNLTKAPELPALTLTKYCYHNMFAGCKSLTTTPELPSTILAKNCYHGMFYECTNLTISPKLPAIFLTQNCYCEMFAYCTNLTIAPELPAKTLAQGCYELMFQSCRNLVSAPELPATTLADYCYQGMFSCCSNLTTAPKLLATTLTEFCYARMFARCTRLDKIEVYFSEWKDYATWEWTMGLNNTGTFKCPSDLPQIFGKACIPKGWSVETF